MERYRLKSALETGRNPANRMKLTTKELDKLLRSKPDRQVTVWDTEERGLSVLVSPGGAGDKATVTFRVTYYLPHQPGAPKYMKLGRYPDLDDLKAVRRQASAIRNAAADGDDPKRPKLSNRFSDVVDEFIEGYAKPKNRTWQETRRIIDRYVLPDWKDRAISDIGRRDVAVLMDKIAAGKIKVAGPNGKTRLVGNPGVADGALTQLSKLFNWYAARSDDFRSPLVRGMKRTRPKARDRVLTDAELRALWEATEDLTVYGAAVRAALLTAQRFHKVSTMRRRDLKARFKLVDGEAVPNVWDPTREDDPENKAVSAVPLSRLALEVINSVPIVDATSPDYEDFVFSVNGRTPFQGWSKAKSQLDARMRELLPADDEWRDWQHRDLRRTAKTLMMRAGVSRDISERCLGHVIGGVEGVYDRWSYMPEKQDAFDRLAALVERIVTGGDNVVALPTGRA